MHPGTPEHRAKDHGDTSPERGWEAYVASYFRRLQAEVPPVVAQSLEADVRTEQAGLAEERGQWVRDRLTAQHFVLTSLVLASERVLLRAHLTREEIVTALRHAFTELWGDWIRRATRRQLDEAPDPFASLVATAKAKEADTYGSTFAFERERDDPEAVWTLIRRCYYHGYFVAHGAPELTPIFCDWDTNWSSAIDPARHGFRFERPTTLGYGADACRFRFTRQPSPEP